MLRKACLRTLHNEVFEDPIYFDDDKNGSVIGYEFRVKDSEARGHHRSYSLLIIMKDRIHLQQLWSFLQHHVHIIAANIKNAAQQIYDMEKDTKESPTLYSNSTSNLYKKCPHKAIRGLVELTNDKLIFAKIHMWFTWILRACVCRLKEEFLCGPPVEDLQIQIEQFNAIECDKQKFEYNLNKNFSLDQIDSIELNHMRISTFQELLNVNKIFFLLSFNYFFILILILVTR